MDALYVEIFAEPENGVCSAPLETLIALFTVRLCFSGQAQVYLVVNGGGPEPAFRVRVTGLNWEVLSLAEVPEAASLCVLPVVLAEEGSTCVAGLCATLRQLVKSALSVSPSHWSGALLGFRHGCLMACAESSVWTCFCEVDMIRTVKALVQVQGSLGEKVLLPVDVARFETHLAQPIRTHNVQKKAQDALRQKGNPSRQELSAVDRDSVLQHCFAEGPSMTLADVILLPCVHIIVQTVGSVYLDQYVPLTLRWYRHVLLQPGVEDAVSLIRDVTRHLANDLYVQYQLPQVPQQSLYKSDPHRYRPRSRVFTRQEEVEASLAVAADLGLIEELYVAPFGSDLPFDWSSLPYEAQPEGGHLPASRRERKSQQLENLTKAVLKVASPGHTIVDFCSGSGHLGIVLAHLLPRCHVVLLENKEESLGRARARVRKLGLPNVSFCQCNLDYFVGHFDIGTSLHACGAATDLVIQRCLSQRAVFVCCPCCYGAVQDNHVVTYPRSRLLRESALTVREYLVLGHSADQTHDEHNIKTDQGKRCMGIIDQDRCLQAAEAGYAVSLAKLIPETCTPKNNLLVGIPQEWQGHSGHLD